MASSMARAPSPSFSNRVERAYVVSGSPVGNVALTLQAPEPGDSVTWTVSRASSPGSCQGNERDDAIQRPGYVRAEVFEVGGLNAYAGSARDVEI
jgi:hypothetical protein